MQIPIEGELKALFDSVPQERKNGAYYDFKEGDRVFIPKVQHRSRGFSSTQVTEYLKSEYKNVIVVKDITKANVIFGYKWDTGKFEYSTWGDKGVRLGRYSDKNLENCIVNNTPYTINGTTYHDTQAKVSYADLLLWDLQNYPYKYEGRARQAGIIVSHYSIIDDFCEIQKHIASTDIVLVTDIKPTLTKVNKFQNKGRIPFTEGLREKVIYAMTFDSNNESDLELLHSNHRTYLTNNSSLPKYSIQIIHASFDVRF